tara:strand:+ start:609 stop:1301 length:693 start_codon:yes stop_codon:yes gene_type:complete
MKRKDSSIIIGSGFIANKFKKYSKFIKDNNLIIYAAGVSNSGERKLLKFQKEKKRFKKFYKSTNKKVVYISTCSINDISRSHGKYAKNKMQIEKFIKKNVEKYLIIRLPEIVGSNSNPFTLTNFFYYRIANNLSLNIYKGVKRNLIDVDDAIKNCIKLLKKNKNKNNTISLLNKQFYSPLKIIKCFEKILRKKAKYRFKIKKHTGWTNQNNYYLKFNDKYLTKVLKKYYK